MPRKATVVLWGLMVLGFYAYFAQPEPRISLPLAETVAGLLVAFAIFFSYFFLRARRGAQIDNEGVALMQQGRVRSALLKFEAARTLLGNQPVVPYNIGMAQLSLWQLAFALREFEVARKTHFIGSMKGLVVPSLALVNAIMGREVPVEHLLAEANQLGVELSPYALLASAVLQVRRGRWAEAQAVLQRYELNMLAGPLRGLAEALRAWCVQSLTGERKEIDLVAMFGEASPEALRGDWPELLAFLEGGQRLSPLPDAYSRPPQQAP